MSESPAKRILIAGIGNIFFGDDAFGSEVARRLMRRTWPDGVHVVDFGIRGLDLAYALLEPYGFAILIDAVPRGGDPGTLYLIEPEIGGNCQDAQFATPSTEMHDMDPAKVLRLVQAMGGYDGRLLLVGCEPMPCEAENELADGLSPPVAAAVDRAMELVQSLVEE